MKDIKTSRGLFRVLGCMFLVTGLVILIVSIFGRENYLIETIQFVTIGIAVMLTGYEVKGKIVFCIQMLLYVVSLGCLLMNHL